MRCNHVVEPLNAELFQVVSYLSGILRFTAVYEHGLSAGYKELTVALPDINIVNGKVIINFKLRLFTLLVQPEEDCPKYSKYQKKYYVQPLPFL